MENMKNLFLEAGKDTTAFSDAAKYTNRAAVRSCSAPTDDQTAILWHKNTPISAKNLLIKAEQNAKISEALLYFDEEECAKMLKNVSISECAKALDTECAGFQYLAVELLARFKKQNRSGSDRPKLIFLVRKNYSLVSLFREGMDLSLASAPHVSAAAASFMAFAENLATAHIKSDFVDFFLILADCADENFKGDAELAQWLFQYLDEFAEQRTKISNRTVQWIKPGSHPFRIGRGFSLFGR